MAIGNTSNATIYDSLANMSTIYIYIYIYMCVCVCVCVCACVSAYVRECLRRVSVCGCVENTEAV